MSSIPLPAMNLTPVQVPDMIGNYERVLRIKQMMQNAPLQRQALEQQVQNGQIEQQKGQMELQQGQQTQQDQQAFRAAMMDPSMQGQTMGKIADTLAQKGAISQASWTAAKKADTDHQEMLQKLDKGKLENAKSSHDAIQQIYSNVMNMPDDQLAQNWGQIAQQYDAVPGSEKMPLDPNKPLTKQQLSQFAPMISMGNTYLDEELKRRESITTGKTAEVDLAKKEQDASYGPTGAAADGKYSFLQKKLASNQPLTADDQAWMKGYEKQKLLVPVTTGNLRIEGFSSMREYPVYDSKSKTTVMVTPNEINRAAKEEPGRYTAPSYTPEALGAKKATEYFVSGKGGQQLTAFNTAMEHLTTLDKLSTDLGNSNIQVFNKAAQAWAQQTGSPAPANFAAAKNAMSGEVAAALKASGSTDQEIAKVGETFDRSQSPAQLRGAINTYRSLLRTKSNNLQQQYEQGMQGRPNFGGNAPAEGTTKTNSHGDKVVFLNGKWGPA